MASARGPGDVLPDDGVADDAEVGNAPPAWSSAINWMTLGRSLIHSTTTYYVPGPEQGTGVPVVSKPGPYGTFHPVDDKSL